MKLTVTGRRLEITDAARRQIDEKLKKLDRVLHESAVSAQCVLSEQRGFFLCELTVHARQDHILRGLGKDGQLSRAVSLAVDKVAQQALRLKDRWKTRRRLNGADRGAPSVEAAPREPGPRVIRSRRPAVKPMSLDDAVLSLSSGDSPFLVFRDASSANVAILYRRPDGHFGLIEPEA